MVKYGLYLGCVAPLRYPGIEASSIAVFNELGLTLLDLDGFSGL